MTAAEADIGLVAADLHLRPFADRFAFGILPHHHRRFLAAVADRAHLAHFIGKGEQPNILQDYANTSSAGSIIAFSKYSDDLTDGDTGLICSFGAGYSVGSVLVQRHG